MPFPKGDFKVFISHATIEDGWLVGYIADALDRIYVRTYVYERYQRGGQNRFDIIKNAIKMCPYFLVVLTKAGVESQWVNQEIGYAVAIGREPIPIVEVDSATGRRIESRGFIELHDPINYRSSNLVGLMSSILYTFYSLLFDQGQWKDLVYLSCKCGAGFDGKLEFEKWWEQWLNAQISFPISWTCVNCGNQIGITFPDFYQLPQR